jgi:hypothetical protein
MIEMKKPSDDEVSAYHEAGHAVFAHLYDVSVKFITIEERPRVKYTLIGNLKNLFNMRIYRIINKAGMKVQEKYCPDVADPRDGKTDKKNFDNSFNFSFRNQLNEAKEIDLIIEKNLKNPEICHKIEILSCELLKERTLYGYDVKKILDAAIIQKR